MMTTIAINKQTHRDAKIICKTLDLTLGELVQHSVLFFKKTGIDPSKSDSGSPLKAIEELNKRVGQVVGYIKTQEQEKLNPLLEHMIILSRRLEDALNKLPASERFDQVIKGVNHHANLALENHRKQMAFLQSSQQRMNEENKRELTALAGVISSLQAEQKEVKEAIETKLRGKLF